MPSEPTFTAAGGWPGRRSSNGCPSAVVRIGSALVDVGLQSVVLVGVFAWYHYVPAWTIVFLPFLFLVTIIMALGAAYLLSALTVTYRDFRFLIPVITQIWMYVSFVP